MGDGARRWALRPPGWTRWGLSSLALGAYLATTGCGSISVNDSTPPPPAPRNEVIEAPAAGVRHDLAILGVDFDPALDPDRLLNHEPVSLLVGISNQGNRRETDVRIKADLWNADSTQLLLHTEKTVDAIAAGNVLPVRLTDNRTPPYFTRYRLTVEIVAVPGEQNTTNNSRRLEILVNSSH